MDKNQTVTELYSLRAGLSLIAQENDKLEGQLAAAEADKTLKIERARMEADAEIARDLSGVQQTEVQKRKVKAEATYEVRRIQREISYREERIQKIHEEAIASAEREVANLKPSEERNKYSELRKEYTYIGGFFEKTDIVKCTFDVLFCLLHIATAIYECWSIHTSNFLWYVFTLAVFVALGIMITECILAHDDWSDDGGFLLPAVSYAGYIVNISFLIASAVIASQLAHVKRDIIIVILIMIFICIGTVLALAVTLSRTSKHFQDSFGGYWDRISSKRKNRRIKKLLKNESAHDNAWAEYDRALNEAIQKKPIETKELREENLAAGKEISNLIQKSRALERDLTVRKVEHESFARKTNGECEARCSEIEAQYNDSCAELKSTHSEISSGIWKTLADSYGKLLDERDWHILDLVIWQLETGRADTIKEALQLADRETQTDRIVSTMRSASDAIAQQIGRGFGNLQAQLSNSFYALACGLANATSEISYQIAQSSRSLLGKMDENAQATATLYEGQKRAMLEANKNIEELFSQSSLQTALLEKANASSNELIKIAKKMTKE